MHDVEDPDLIRLGESSRPPLRVNRALVETDLVIVVSAAESVLHGGPATLLGAAGADALRASGAYSLLETTASQGWHLATTLEYALERHVPLLGVSLVLNHPEVSGALRGYPYDPAALERIARLAIAICLGALPELLRRDVCGSCEPSYPSRRCSGVRRRSRTRRRCCATVELRRAELDRPLDALVIGVPGVTPYLPRERPNPLSRRTSGSGSRCGCGATRSRLSTAAPRSSSTASRGGSLIRRSSRTGRSSMRRARARSRLLADAEPTSR